MKHIKSRIAAAVFAAATALCTMQSVTASALGFTLTSQDQREYGMYFAHDLYWIQQQHQEGSPFNQSVMSGPVYGNGFTYSNYSGNQWGTTLTGQEAWTRYLANRFYTPDVIYMEHANSVINCYGDARDLKQGDQLVLKRNGVRTYVFVTGTSTGNIICSEMINNNGLKVHWGSEFSRNNGTMTRLSNGQQYTLEYVVRPVKQGDANGDSIVSFGDVTWVNNNTGWTGASGVAGTVRIAAADVNKNGQIDSGDCMEIYNHYGYGRMSGEYGYVTYTTSGFEFTT